MIRVFDAEAIPGFDGYVITKCGRVFRLPYLRWGRWTELRELKTVKAEYLQCEIHLKGKRTTQKVHRLLALTYIPNPEGHPQVNHIDGDKFNNSLDNLEWCSAQKNVLHSYEKGLACNKGERNPSSIFTEQDVKDIRLRRKKGDKLKNIAEDYGCHLSTICKITTQVNWS